MNSESLHVTGRGSPLPCGGYRRAVGDLVCAGGPSADVAEL